MIPYGRQSINKDDIRAVTKALKSDWLTTGPMVEKFELLLQNIVGAPCISVSSGTAALHCAYAAIGLEPGDEVITPPITFLNACFFFLKVLVYSKSSNINIPLLFNNFKHFFPSKKTSLYTCELST